ncbi:hypothetical protein [Geodermatophilus sp. SYSU D00815]
MTFWDAEFETCWLLAWNSYHASGDYRDVYNYFERLHDSGQLPPTTEDFERLLTETPAALIDALRDIAPQMISEARSYPGSEVRRDFVASVALSAAGTAMMTVDIVCEVDGSMEQGWLGLLIPPEATWPAEGALALAAALAPPEVPSSELHWSETVGGRPTMPNELAFTWTQQTA